MFFGAHPPRRVYHGLEHQPVASTGSPSSGCWIGRVPHLQLAGGRLRTAPEPTSTRHGPEDLVSGFTHRQLPVASLASCVFARVREEPERGWRRVARAGPQRSGTPPVGGASVGPAPALPRPQTGSVGRGGALAAGAGLWRRGRGHGAGRGSGGGGAPSSVRPGPGAPVGWEGANAELDSRQELRPRWNSSRESHESAVPMGGPRLTGVAALQGACGGARLGVS